MKKTIVVLLTLLMIAALAVPALADGSVVFTVSPSKSSVAPGETVNFTVSVSSSTQVTSMGFVIDLKGAPFELVSVQGADIDGALVPSFGVDVGGGAVKFKNPSSYSGKFLTFTLKAKADAELKSYSIGGKGSAKLDDQNVASSVKGTTVTVAAAECKHEFGKWEKVDGELHQRTCNKCGKVEKQKHNWIAKWKSDKSGHWHECADCHTTTKVESHKPGPEATEQKAQTCTVCGYELKPKLEPGHKHTYSNEWSFDGDGHWHVCTKRGCYAKVDYHAHVYDNECDSVCNVCGAPRMAPHVHNGEWRGDATGHWHACTRCGEKVDFTPHKPGPEATQDSPQVCLTCGFVIKPALGDHVHKFEDNWQSDDNEHWHQCQCGEKADVEAHKWDEGTVTKAPTQNADGEKTFTCTVCGKVKTEVIPHDGGATAPSAPTENDTSAASASGSNSLWGIVAIVAVLLALVGVGILAWLLLPLNKNRHGKFSS